MLKLNMDWYMNTWYYKMSKYRKQYVHNSARKNLNHKQLSKLSFKFHFLKCMLSFKIEGKGKLINKIVLFQIFWLLILNQQSVNLVLQ